MKYLWPAIKAQFDGSVEWRKVGRKIFRGFDGVPVSSRGPYTVVDEFQPSETSDTFGSDIEVFFLEFRFYSGSPLPDKCDEWVDATIGSFDEARLLANGFHTVQVLRLRVGNPVVDNGSYRTFARYRVTIQMFQQHPVPVS